MQIAFSTSNKLSNSLGSAKDKLKPEEQAGIYKISCNDCEKTYVGQTKRSLLTRFKEHIAHFKYNRVEKSSVALHMSSEKHLIDIRNLELVTPICNPSYLDAYETLIIKKLSPELNSDSGPLAGSSLTNSYPLLNQLCRF